MESLLKDVLVQEWAASEWAFKNLRQGKIAYVLGLTGSSSVCVAIMNLIKASKPAIFKERKRNGYSYGLFCDRHGNDRKAIVREILGNPRAMPSSLPEEIQERARSVGVSDGPDRLTEIVLHLDAIKILVNEIKRERPDNSRLENIKSNTRRDPVPNSTFFLQAILRSVDEFGWSTRVRNYLRFAGTLRIGDLVQKSEADILRIPNIGRESLREIKETLADMGLHLGMDVPNWPPAGDQEDTFPEVTPDWRGVDGDLK